MYKLTKIIAASIAVPILLGSHVAFAASKKEVLNHYSDIAYAKYGDSVKTAKVLQKAIGTLIEKPVPANLEAAKKAWKDARVPYQQTEVYRFGNAIVDDWEGKVNAWPLDEGLIDYVASSYGSTSDENSLYTANVIANKSITLSGKTIDTSVITKTLLSETLHEVDGVEANVATGYHAIEFLLWGQDLNGTGEGAGARPVTDYDVSNCSSGNCDRRGEYLKVVTELLIDDLEWMHKQWNKDGAARQALLKDEDAGITSILTGLGSLSYGELAGERIKLGVLLHDPEEEHDCFSDNTHNSHFYDILGMQNVYTGNYTSVDGKVLSGPSISDLIKKKDSSIDQNIQAELKKSLSAANVLVVSSEQDGIAYDQLLAEGNTEGNKKILNVVDALLKQTLSFEKAVAILGISPIEFEGSDSLDAPKNVFQ